MTIHVVIHLFVQSCEEIGRGQRIELCFFFFVCRCLFGLTFVGGSCTDVTHQHVFDVKLRLLREKKSNLCLPLAWMCRKKKKNKRVITEIVNSRAQCYCYFTLFFHFFFLFFLRIRFG